MAKVGGWTHERDTILTDMYLSGAKVDDICVVLGVRPRTVYKRAKKIGLKRERAGGWSPEDDKVLLDAYASSSVNELALLLGRTRLAVIDRATKKLGINKRQHDVWTSEEEKRVLSSYGKVPLAELAATLGRHTPSSVKKKANNLGLRYTKEQESKKNRKYSCNEEFFATPNLLNSYWAGFLAADGCVSFARPTVAVSLASKDRGHLETLKQDISFTGTVLDSTSFCNLVPGRVMFTSTLAISCTWKWKRDLKNVFNVTPKKTATLGPPSGLSFPQKLAYVCGILDGDGSKGVSTNTPYLNFMGTKSVMCWIQETLTVLDISYGAASVIAYGSVFRYRPSGKKVLLLESAVQDFKLPLLVRKWGPHIGR